MLIGRIINRKILIKFNLKLIRTNPRPFDFVIKGKDLIGAEIGVFRGVHALSMLKRLDIKKLYLIDPYEMYDGFNCKEELEGGENINILSNAEKRARKRLRKYEDKIVWIKKYSEDAIKDIKEELDFVYIDAAHDYINVTKDIKNYYPLVKEGGIFGGHDIDNGVSKPHEGLTKAVLEFVNKFKLTLFVGNNDWWCKKPDSK